MEKLIPNTRKRYTISDEGIIYSHYRYNNIGKKLYNKKEIKKYINSPLATSIYVKLKINRNELKAFSVNSLIVKLFKIKQPDIHHKYDIICKDGNLFNTNVNNIGFKIRMEKNNGYLFYPQPFYNSRNKIISKICGECGVNKSINHFHLQNKHEDDQYLKTYRNICEQCRSKKQWNYIKSNPVIFKKVKERSTNWAKSEAGKNYYIQYRKILGRKNYNDITPHYVYSSLRLYEYGIKLNEMPSDLYNLDKKRIKLYRKHKQLKANYNEKN